VKGHLEISSDQVKETKKGKGTFKGMLEKSHTSGIRKQLDTIVDQPYNKHTLFRINIISILLY